MEGRRELNGKGCPYLQAGNCYNAAHHHSRVHPHSESYREYPKLAGDVEDTSRYVWYLHSIMVPYPLLPDSIETDWSERKNQFPWKGLPKILADKGILLENYPHTVQLPCGNPTKAHSKGINDLNKQEVKDLHEAITNKMFPLRFRRLPKEVIGACILFMYFTLNLSHRSGSQRRQKSGDHWCSASSRCSSKMRPEDVR
jgi:hypothetical protein